MELISFCIIYTLTFTHALTEFLLPDACARLQELRALLDKGMHPDEQKDRVRSLLSRVWPGRASAQFTV